MVSDLCPAVDVSIAVILIEDCSFLSEGRVYSAHILRGNENRGNAGMQGATGRENRESGFKNFITQFKKNSTSETYR